MEMISARYLQPRPGPRNDTNSPTSREAVAAHLRARARGVLPVAAHEQMKHFFRSSGHDWALVLA
jgi:hypothetical protein